MVLLNRDFNIMKKCLERICGIYKIQNKVNGKVYIGQSVNIKKRFYIHRYNAYNKENKSTYDLYLYIAMRKYGKDNFTYEIIEVCEKGILDQREIYWIKYYKSNQKEYGYNLSDGGHSTYVKEIKNNSNITNKKSNVEKIKYLLLNSELSIQEIAKECDVTPQTVTNINRGKVWKCIDDNYPLRDTRKKTIYYCQKCGSKLSNKYSKLCRKCESERQHKLKGHFINVETFEKDLDNYGLRELSKKYNVSEQTIYRWSKKYNLKLKRWNQKRRLKYEQI